MLKTYSFSIILILSVFLGGFTGHIFGESVRCLKPLGDIFLNLIFTAIVPLVFFSVSSAIARAGVLGKLTKILSSMTLVFLITSAIAAALTIIVVKIFPPAKDVYLALNMPAAVPTGDFLNQIAGIFTVPEFSKLLSHTNMLALILFAILIGLGSTSSQVFTSFLNAGEAVLMRVFSYIMYFAPIGFFAYFAVLVSELGPALIQSYVRVSVIYYVFAVIYFIAAYSLYAYWAGKRAGVRTFWKYVSLPATTSVATCSSAASIPANLIAARSMGISAEVYETVVPLGAILHKEGSVIGGVVKIAFLFGIFHMNFSGASVLLMALGVSLLVGTVMGAIPSGGMLGELLILTVYGFPSEALVVIAAISVIIDPIATLLNVTGNTVSSMMVARMVDRKQ
ncbi:MAG: dicarboxylate/amino acid:cation symporter [Myxococcaceae bacterium]